jgi:hypothetical protein
MKKKTRARERPIHTKQVVIVVITIMNKGKEKKRLSPANIYAIACTIGMERETDMGCE